MPVQIQTPERAPETSGALSSEGRGLPRVRLVLTPHKSLTPEGFVWFIGLTAALISVPLLSILGTAVFWALLPFLVAAVFGVWIALKRSWKDRDIREELAIWDDLIRLERTEPRRPPRDWEANPHWVEVRLTQAGGPVPNYVTLRGAGREVEVGAFLSETERLGLHELLDRHLRASPV